MKKTTKENVEKLKLDFTVAVKDKKRWLLCGIEILIIVLLIVFDMLTKKYIFGYCDTNRDIIIFRGVIRFTAVINTGAGFGMMKDKTTLLTVISFISALILIVLVFYSYPRQNKWLRSSLVLIIAGAVGNLVDRMFLGYVRDFVYFELIDFAIFNFADSFLTIGTILLIIYVLFFYSKEEEEIAKQKKMLLASNNENTEGENLPLGEVSTKSDTNANCESQTISEINTDSATKANEEDLSTCEASTTAQVSDSDLEDAEDECKQKGDK